MNIGLPRFGAFALSSSVIIDLETTRVVWYLRALVVSHLFALWLQWCVLEP